MDVDRRSGIEVRQGSDGFPKHRKVHGAQRMRGKAYGNAGVAAIARGQVGRYVKGVRRIGLEPGLNENHYHYAQRVLDTAAQGVRVNLAYACTDVGINTSGVDRHRAAGDAALTQQLFEKLLQVHPPQAFWLGGKYAI